MYTARCSPEHLNRQLGAGWLMMSPFSCSPDHLNHQAFRWSAYDVHNQVQSRSFESQTFLWLAKYSQASKNSVLINHQRFFLLLANMSLSAIPGYLNLN
jgi:hypothetical protein